MQKRKLVILLGLLPIVILAENIWIGNGSVMSAYKTIVTDKEHAGPYPYGVNKDMTKLHDTYYDTNVGFFQWFVNKTTCERLKIYTKTNSQKVNISIGPWHSRSIDRTFKNIDLPFIIGKENVGVNNFFDDDDWLVTAVKFTETTNKEGLYAECTRESITDISPTTTNGSNIIVDGYKWQGNGSIISGYFESQYGLEQPTRAYLNPSNQWPFGIFKDVSKFHKYTDKQVVFFQWLKSNECPNLEIDILDNYDRDGNLIDIVPENKKNVKLISKNWDSTTGTPIEQNVKLPYILKGERLWSVLGVYSDKTFNKDYRVQAKCTTNSQTSDNSNNSSDSDVSSTVLSFLSTYFTLTDNQRALNITNHLSTLNMLDNYVDGLENYTDPTEEVLYSLEFFLRHSPDVFGGEYVSEGTLVKSYREMQTYLDNISLYTGETQHLYLDIEEEGIFSDSDINNANVKIYPTTQYNTETQQYETIDSSDAIYYSYEGKYIGGIYGYSFGEVVSGLYVVEITRDGKKNIKSIFVPMKNQYTINITLSN